MFKKYFYYIDTDEISVSLTRSFTELEDKIRISVRPRNILCILNSFWKKFFFPRTPQMSVENSKSYAKNDTFCFKGKNNRAARAARTFGSFLSRALQNETVETVNWYSNVQLLKRSCQSIILSYYTMWARYMKKNHENYKSALCSSPDQFIYVVPASNSSFNCA